MIQEYLKSRKKGIYSRAEWEALGSDGQCRIGYADGYVICQKHGLRPAKYLQSLKPINSYEQGKKQAAIDWLSDSHVKVCGNCGHMGTDVQTRLIWIGGQGYIPITDCDNLVACWQRWDAKNLRGK